jgi:hypothetical protein
MALVALAATLLAAAGTSDAAQKFLVPDGNRSAAVHRIPMLADPVLKGDDKPIGPEDTPVLPYSPRATCSARCHDYAIVEGGWHFSAPDPKVAPGRPGEPYFLTDLKTGTQIPVSPRGWPGTYKPSAVGLTPWKFMLAFGGHTPGGGYGEKFIGDMQADPAARWQVSGKIEIDCQGCHSGDPMQDQSNWASNLERENFMWAATASSAIGMVRGNAKTVPETWDPMTPATGDNPKEFPPSVVYDKWRFNAANLTGKEPAKNWEVFFNVNWKPSNERCFFCHTNHPLGKDAPKKFQENGDVHLAAGLNCADCHRHDLDHNMARGYEGETIGGTPATLTCRGCHLGEQSAAAGPDTMGGRLGAPVPAHKGIPTVHFKKLACTTCHSGPMPDKTVMHVQTSRAHNLGVKAKEHRDDAPPFIQWPVFMRDESGRIAPNKVAWPAFWGRMKDDKVTPMAPEAVQEVGGDALATDELRKWKPLSEDQIKKILTALAAKKDAGEPVFVTGGKLYRLAGGALTSAEHAAAAPYAWPVAHDVRAKTQSLGAGGCTDCHSTDSPIAFGQVAADSMAETQAPLTKVMYEFQGRNPLELKAWAMSYMFRPMFKVVGFATAALLAAVLALYLFLGLAAFLRWASKKAPQG